VADPARAKLGRPGAEHRPREDIRPPRARVPRRLGTGPSDRPRAERRHRNRQCRTAGPRPVPDRGTGPITGRGSRPATGLTERPTTKHDAEPVASRHRPDLRHQVDRVEAPDQPDRSTGSVAGQDSVAGRGSRPTTNGRANGRNPREPRLSRTRLRPRPTTPDRPARITAPIPTRTPGRVLTGSSRPATGRTKRPTTNHNTAPVTGQDSWPTTNRNSRQPKPTTPAPSRTRLRPRPTTPDRPARITAPIPTRTPGRVLTGSSRPATGRTKQPTTNHNTAPVTSQHRPDPRHRVAPPDRTDRGQAQLAKSEPEQQTAKPADTGPIANQDPTTTHNSGPTDQGSRPIAGRRRRPSGHWNH